MDKKVLAIGIVLILIIIAIVGITFSINANVVKEKPVVKIGVILPLTGDMAFMGQSAKDAMLLAKEQLDNTKYEYELIFEDDKMNPTMTSTAVNKLVNVDNVGALVSVFSSSGNVVSPVAEENKIVHIGVASDKNVAKGRYNFIHWTTSEEEVRVFIEELKKRGYRKLAEINVNLQGALAVADETDKQIKGTNITVVSKEVFNIGDKDFRTILLKAEGKNPEIYVIHGYSPELEILGKQFKELVIKKPITSIEAFEFTRQPELFEGYWYVNAAEPNEKFLQAFKARYSKIPEIGSANAYDIFNLLVTAFERADDDERPSSAEVVLELERIKNFSGALGILNVDQDHIIQSKAVVKEVRNGGFVVVD